MELHSLDKNHFNKSKILLLIVTVLLCVFHFYAVAYFLNEELKSSLLIEGSSNSQLFVVHIGLLILLFGYFVTLSFNNLISRITSLIISLLTMLIYYFWYQEKFKNMEPEGTFDYYEQLREYGWFKGALTLDYLAFYLTIILVLYSLFVLIYFHIYKRANSYQ